MPYVLVLSIIAQMKEKTKKIITTGIDIHTYRVILFSTDTQ